MHPNEKGCRQCEPVSQQAGEEQPVPNFSRGRSPLSGEQPAYLSVSSLRACLPTRRGGTTKQSPYITQSLQDCFGAFNIFQALDFPTAPRIDVTPQAPADLDSENSPIPR